jgi:hypothetical protein
MVGMSSDTTSNERSNAGPWDQDTKRKFKKSVTPNMIVADKIVDPKLTRMIDCSKAKSEYLDPCQEAAERSIRCLNRNGGDRKMCNTYFEYVTSLLRPTELRSL